MVYQHIHSPVNPPTHPSTNQLIHPPTNSSIHSSIHPSVHTPPALRVQCWVTFWHNQPHNILVGPTYDCLLVQMLECANRLFVSEMKSDHNGPNISRQRRRAIPVNCREKNTIAFFY